jgi:hypothetical protein
MRADYAFSFLCCEKIKVCCHVVRWEDKGLLPRGKMGKGANCNI